MTRAARAALVALVGALWLGASSAEAHLIPARQGTVNLVGDAAFVVLSVPTSALHEADEDGDGLLDTGEFQRHEAALRAEIDRRLTIADGATAGTTVRVDLILSPQHDAVRDRADQIVALKHVRFGAPPVDLRVDCDLFGVGEAEREFRITATRHPASGKETQVAVLVPGSPAHAFFSPLVPAAPEPPGALVRGEAPRRGLVALGMILAAAAALSWASWSRSRGVGQVSPPVG